MAFLLLLHEKMRLQRKVNKLTLRQAKLSSRKERITKNISRVQKMYSSKMTQLEKQSSLWTSNFKNQMLNDMGLGMQNQMFSPMGGFGITSFVAKAMGQFLANGGKPIQIGKDKAPVDFTDGSLYAKMMQDYCSGGFQAVYDQDDNGNDITTKVTGYKGASGENYTVDQYSCFQRAMQMAQQQQSQAQFYAQQVSSQYESNVSVWLQAAQAQLEEEQDAALLPLEAEETEIDLDNQSCEAQLADARARLEGIQQACSDGIKNSAPTFGLG